jgi:TatD DNase family protein
MPLQALLLETDSPDMPLMGQQGQENSPVNIATIASCLAQLRAQTIDEIAQVTSANTRRLFNLPERNF